MRKLKMFAVAFVLATGAFWVTMLKDPPKTMAADPMPSIVIQDLKIPSDLPLLGGADPI